jgi:hypothetical protein
VAAATGLGSFPAPTLENWQSSPKQSRIANFIFMTKFSDQQTPLMARLGAFDPEARGRGGKI